jgi:hypothetical protein
MGRTEILKSCSNVNAALLSRRIFAIIAAFSPALFYEISGEVY